MKKVIVILGQTATGKSDLAVKIAQKVNGEIISADSRQVYKGLDIGTGKITKKEMKGVPHHLLDVVNPKKRFSVQEYQTSTNLAIRDIVAKGRIPILCGGTGFYIDAVTKGMILPEVPPNKKLRKNLETKSVEMLFTILKKLDKARAKSIDAKNKVRLIRAIEIATVLGKVPKIQEIKPKYNFIKIGLYLPSDKLQEKIKNRLIKRTKSGMLNEAQKLRKIGLPFKRMEELGLEYRYMALHLQGKISKQQMIENLNTEIYQYAKRQMTWFKRDKKIKWFDSSNRAEYKKIEKYITSNL